MRCSAALWIGITGVAGCVHAAATSAPPRATADSASASVAAPTPVAPPSKSAAAPAPAASRCDGLAGLVLRIPDTVLTCEDEFRQCSGKPHVEVTSCYSHVVRVQRLEVPFPGGGMLEVEFTNPDLQPGEVLARDISLWREGTYQARVRFAVLPDGAEQVAETTFRVTNPKREAALAACEQCSGQWGSWGMTGREGCNCRMKDAGKVCHDGDECEGRCIFERYEVVREPSGPVCGGSDCKITLGLGVPAGRCSEFQMVFGCHSFIDAGESKKPPRVLPGRASRTCVD